MLKNAGIIIIGDEILSGRVQDSNSLFMAGRLRACGVDLLRIAVIPDDVVEISEEVGRFAARFDYVFTSGGIGPTHDDVTIEGVSRAFGVPTVVDETLRALLETFYGEKLSPERLKMAEVPEGARLVQDETLRFPLIACKNVFIFPGIPEYLKTKFHVIEKDFQGPKIHLRTVYISEQESVIAPYLNDVVRRNARVKIGSYPNVSSPKGAGRSDHLVMFTLESTDPAELDDAVRMIKESPMSRFIVRVET
jgi:molybdenum cofactor synthesis domain-containing protein